MLVGVAIWEFGWDRKRRAARQAVLVSAQQAPGTQALRSEVGKAHWSDRLPQPLRAISQTAPVTILAVGVLLLALLLTNVFGELGNEGPDVHARLEEGSSGEVEPKFGEDYRIRVTILTIADEVEVPQGRPAARPPSRSTGRRKSRSRTSEPARFLAPGWKLEDTQGIGYVPRIDIDMGDKTWRRLITWLPARRSPAGSRSRSTTTRRFSGSGSHRPTPWGCTNPTTCTSTRTSGQPQPRVSRRARGGRRGGGRPPARWTCSTSENKGKGGQRRSFREPAMLE